MQPPEYYHPNASSSFIHQKLTLQNFALYSMLHWRRKVTKSGGANLLTKQYFYCKKLKSYGALLYEVRLQPHSPTPSTAYGMLTHNDT